MSALQAAADLTVLVAVRCGESCTCSLATWTRTVSNYPLALLCCCPCSALALLTAVRLRADLNNAVYFFEEMLKEKNAPTDECGLCTAVAACMSSS